MTMICLQNHYMSLRRIFSCLFLAVLFAGGLFMACDAAPLKTAVETTKIVSAGRDKAALVLEVALDPASQERGLMFRKEMPENHGMIFIFPDNLVPRVWMKNTLISLDVLFVDQDGRIVDIYPNARPLDLTPIASRFPCRAFIEINGGQAKALKLEMGDLVLSDALDRAVRFGAGVSE